VSKYTISKTKSKKWPYIIWVYGDNLIVKKYKCRSWLSAQDLVQTLENEQRLFAIDKFLDKAET
jgi:hypothetical protein